MTSNKKPPCRFEQGKHDILHDKTCECFAVTKHDKCTILNDTTGYSNMCPFYKSKKQFEMDAIKYPYNPFYKEK